MLATRRLIAFMQPNSVGHGLGAALAQIPTDLETHHVRRHHGQPGRLQRTQHHERARIRDNKHKTVRRCTACLRMVSSNATCPGRFVGVTRGNCGPCFASSAGSAGSAGSASRSPKSTPVSAAISCQATLTAAYIAARSASRAPSTADSRPNGADNTAILRAVACELD